MRSFAVQEVKKRIEEEMNEGFPEGRSHERGNALLLAAVAVSEVNKLFAAFGGCSLCYGKGYATQMAHVTVAPDMPGDVRYNYAQDTTYLKYCCCDRGKQLEKHVEGLQAGSTKIGFGI